MAISASTTPQLLVEQQGHILVLTLNRPDRLNAISRDMLDELAAKHPKRLKVWYTVDRAPKGWKYSEGFITAEMIAERLPGPKESTLILMCGPPPMIKFACQANLDKLGYPKPMQICF